LAALHTTRDIPADGPSISINTIFKLVDPIFIPNDCIKPLKKDISL
jgi:hypothetical protein